MNKYPKATVNIRPIKITVKINDEGEILPKPRRKEQQATETIRTGRCPEHPDGRGIGRRSTSFEGANEYGWIFWCTWGRHYFLNTPPGQT